MVEGKLGLGYSSFQIEDEMQKNLQDVHLTSDKLDNVSIQCPSFRDCGVQEVQHKVVEQVED